MRTSRALPLTLFLTAACANQCPPARVQTSQPFKLLNPLLETVPSLDYSELRPFQYKMQKFIDDRKKAGDVSHISIYFRDLSNGPIYAFNEKEPFSPASLLKLPLLIAVLKLAESNPAFLTKRVVNNVSEMVSRNIGTSVLETDKEYTVDELLHAMIAASDNRATILLRNVTDPELLDSVYRDLGLLIPEVRTADDNMTVREYATFFRILYNASYLGNEGSEKALDYLAASEFKQGLPSGVPPDVTVAHKFGERAFTGDSVKQLHDCGIVYYKPLPYVLCVMTRGENFQNLTGVIRDASKLIYTEVHSQTTKR